MDKKPDATDCMDSVDGGSTPTNTWVANIEKDITNVRDVLKRKLLYRGSGIESIRVELNFLGCKLEFVLRYSEESEQGSGVSA